MIPISISSRELLKLDAPNEEGAKCEPDDEVVPGMEMATEGVPKFMVDMLISFDPSAWDTFEPLPLPLAAPPPKDADEEPEAFSVLLLN